MSSSTDRSTDRSTNRVQPEARLYYSPPSNFMRQTTDKSDARCTDEEAPRPAQGPRPYSNFTTRYAVRPAMLLSPLALPCKSDMSGPIRDMSTWTCSPRRWYSIHATTSISFTKLHQAFSGTLVKQHRPPLFLHWPSCTCPFCPLQQAIENSC